MGRAGKHIGPRENKATVTDRQRDIRKGGRSPGGLRVDAVFGTFLDLLPHLLANGFEGQYYASNGQTEEYVVYDTLDGASALFEIVYRRPAMLQALIDPRLLIKYQHHYSRKIKTGPSYEVG